MKQAVQVLLPRIVAPKRKLQNYLTITLLRNRSDRPTTASQLHAKTLTVVTNRQSYKVGEMRFRKTFPGNEQVLDKSGGDTRPPANRPRVLVDNARTAQAE